jgi:hypothetical protein
VDSDRFVVSPTAKRQATAVSTARATGGAQGPDTVGRHGSASAR